jgi:hypothetical protein
MSKPISVLTLALFVFVAGRLCAFPSQESSVTRTHLMRDTEASTLVVAVGLEPSGENVEYMSDAIFGYIGYAPYRWLEAGIAAHNLSFGLYPSVDAKIDLMEFFSDDTPWSCMLMGGVGGLPKDPDYPVFFHGGAAVDYRLRQWLQLYAGAGSDSVARALSLQIGAYMNPFKWFGASANFKLVIGSEGVEPMASAALFVIGRYTPHSGP